MARDRLQQRHVRSVPALPCQPGAQKLVEENAAAVAVPCAAFGEQQRCFWQLVPRTQPRCVKLLLQDIMISLMTLHHTWALSSKGVDAITHMRTATGDQDTTKAACAERSCWSSCPEVTG